jgi:signal peptidase I
VKDINKGDVVICHYPEEGNKRFIKRVIAKGNDTVYIKDGHLYVNEQDRTEIYYKDETFETDMEAVTVPEGCYFVIGDNVNNSIDSRFVGPLTKKQILGVVILKVYPKIEKF